MAKLQRQYVSKLVPENPTLLLAVLIAVAIVNSVTLGYDSSMMNGLAIKTTYTDYFHINTATEGLNNAAGWIGNFMACFFMQPFADKWGRKTGILIAACVCFVGILIQAAAQNTGMFVVGRIIVGLGSELSSAAAPTLIGELIPASSRGAILGFFYSCFYLGGIIASGINYGTRRITTTWSWRIPSILQVIPSLLAIVLLPFIPESPRWLVQNGQHEHALEVLVIFQGQSNHDSVEVQKTFEEIETTLASENDMYKGNPWSELISTPANRKRLIIAVSFGLMIELFGNFVVSYYLGSILDQAGITNTDTQLKISLILSCWCFAMAIFGSFMLDILGRRIQTLGGITGMIISLCLLGGLISRFGESSNKSGIYGSIAAIFLFQGCFSFSITPLTCLYPTEVFQYKLRNAGISVFRFLDTGCGLMASFAMSYGMANLGWKFYIVNASYDLLFLACVYFFWVETKGISLEEIALQFSDTIVSTSTVTPHEDETTNKLEEKAINKDF
ncbi:hypothetical protein BP6252_08907 [Coleophoma cylindrospora]|uniref:Major facilitator superfamily (MFS) profile domain-containing protein n=1 Tax=Coleophoma cylindrospora TaxID=1849047 RepID=A0A3D8R0S7_9HELO|nr:hypothetical protein BP6252_08907 [Coleophoma cylindrospora]